MESLRKPKFNKKTSKQERTLKGTEKKTKLGKRKSKKNIKTQYRKKVHGRWTLTETEKQKKGHKNGKAILTGTLKKSRTDSIYNKIGVRVIARGRLL